MAARDRHLHKNAAPTKKEQLRQIKKRQSTIFMAAVGIILMLIAVGAFYYIPKVQADMAALNGPNLTPQSISGPAIDIELTDLNGLPVKLSDYKGNVILYNAWATWCPPCKEEMPILAEYYLEHADEGFVIVAISDAEPVEAVKSFYQANNIPFPMWPDPTHIASDLYGIDGLPTSFVIDRDFNVVYRWSGGVNKAVLDTFITPLLSQ